LFTRKNIKIIKRYLKLFIFKIITKSNKEILEKNNFYIKKILSNASLRKVNYNIIVYKSRVKKIFENIVKKRVTIFIKINKNIYLKIVIKKIE
jgi:hypothetical protein